MSEAKPVSPRARLQELQAIPDNHRTDAEWDELNELEIMFAPGNRIGTPDRMGNAAVSTGGGGGRGGDRGPRRKGGGGGAGGGGGGGGGQRQQAPQPAAAAAGDAGAAARKPARNKFRKKPARPKPAE
jgi:hypothetical protein